MFSAQCNNQTWPEVKQINWLTGWSHWTQTFSSATVVVTHRGFHNFEEMGSGEWIYKSNWCTLFGYFSKFRFQVWRPLLLRSRIRVYILDQCSVGEQNCYWQMVWDRYIIGVFKPGTLLKLGLWVLKMQTWVLGLFVLFAWGLTALSAQIGYIVP